MVEHAQPAPEPLHLAMIGTRGVPAAYGGFETAVEEIGSRLAGRGHDVSVYCRHAEDTTEHEYAGMHLVHLPALRLKAAETLSHTALSVAHVAMHRHHPDAAFVFNAANAPFVPLLHARGVPVAVHVDGLEWQRDKWHGAGRAYYRWAEQSAVRHADALIADAKGIADYYASEFGASTRQIAYGAPLQLRPVSDRLEALGLLWKGYHLVVARFEPENHVDLIVAGYEQSHARRPLVVVGAAPYAAEYTARVRSEAHEDPRVRLLGAMYDQDLLDQLYAGALSYAHGHSVGGTNPSLLRAMGAGTAVLAWDCPFNREVAGEAGRYFGDAASLAALFDATEREPDRAVCDGAALRDIVRTRYRWDDVAVAYEQLAIELKSGMTTRARGRRRIGDHHAHTAADAPSARSGIERSLT